MKNRGRVACLLLAGFFFVVRVSAAEETAPSPAAPAEAADPRLESARKDLEEGRWREARKKAKAVLSGDKRSPEGWVILGRVRLLQGRYRKAVRRFRKAVKHDPHYAAAYYWRGVAFEKWGKLDEAANEYQAAFHADPGMETARDAWKRLRDQVAAPGE